MKKFSILRALQWQLPLVLLCALIRHAAAAPSWSWIWSRAGAGAPQTLYFRRTFQLSAMPARAILRITADDSFRAYVNGSRQPLATGSDWSMVQSFDVTRALRPGQNLLAVEVTNLGGPGGLLYKLQLRFRNGRTAGIYSSGSTHVSVRAPALWRTLQFDDSGWPAAVTVAPVNGGPWGALRGPPVPDPSRLVRVWSIRAGGKRGEDPYFRDRRTSDRMLMSTNASSRSDMEILAGEGFTLFQTDSDHLSTEEVAPGHWDWSAAESARDAVQAEGLDWSYFEHEAFPPAWFARSTPFVRIQCLEHHLPIRAFS
ncbi:MAG TPA: hypothetical protein VGS41_12035, partial [Chthonomonadales bacterium]|nr:hypothetical protein [Chthonomonadales bacterium]